MIVSSLGELVFFHNPKAAGASVHKSLAPFHDGNVRGWTIAEDGTEQAHYMIDEFAARFPDEWERIRGFRFFALYRDIEPRFYSSVAQYSRIYGDVDIRFSKQDATRKFLFDVIDQLSKYGPAENIVHINEFTAFRPQWMYCQSENHDIDINVFAVQQMEQMYQAMEARMGVELTRERVNEREGFDLPRPVAAALSYRSLTRRFAGMPGASVAKRVLSRMSKAGKTRDPWGLSDVQGAEIREFLRSFYGRDIEFIAARKAAQSELTN